MAKVKKKILVVDDSRTNLVWAQMHLEKDGYEVVTRDEPLGTTLEVLREKPDLILLDVEMPLLQGNEIVPTLKSGRGATLPVVLYSSLPLPELKARVESSGANGFIQKTHNAPDFLRQIRKYFENPDATASKHRVVLLSNSIKCAAITSMILQEFPDIQLDKYLTQQDALDNISRENNALFMIVGAMDAQPDLCSMDIVEKAAKELRIPVILFAYENDLKTVNDVTDAGVTHCLLRPVPAHALRAAVRDVLGSTDVAQWENKRQQQRLRVAVAATFEGDEVLRSVTWDLNEHGAFIFTPKIRPTGSLATINLTIPGTDTPISMDCEVVYSRPKSAGSFPMGMGVSFDRASKKDKKALRSALTME